MGDAINRDAIRAVIQSYRAMGLTKDPKTMIENGTPQWQGTKNLAIYDEHFEKPYLEDTAEEYQRRSMIWINTENVMEYLRNLNAAFEVEDRNSDDWFDPTTKEKVIKIMVETLVSKNAEAVCEKDTGCDLMFAEKKLDELENLYRHFRRDPNAYVHIINKMSPYLLKRGEENFCDPDLLNDPI